ncbi:Plant invertase/pectin methylesterase inhibitor superfamily protein [Arabidopsis thaliana]|uniref:Plant invertase/pectin methylesterase inhibitor superfamily protein n=1 Tax=Arabidopsis thaliana TaxID=3702 RepID=F4JC28_ARATH|nr:Plant invertase/pectin methylesterase inhibitor superfamily protein [Arabidopsis thaliana]AEE74435.1 Plant invertase/pectin methylesterase inhibitor superfamily protein [Arabidopsis thaliana]|eukprot:NP_683536.1 Plant invertase/pectin methylesterase inhibitor superfamily protein [Arabidopsis thaliana]
MEFNKTYRIIVIFTVSILVTISTHVESRSDSPFSTPAPAPEVMKPIASPANSPAEIYTDSPVASPEAPADSFSPKNPPVEIDIYSPAASPEAPVASPEAPAESSSAAPSGIKVSSSPKSLLNPPLLSPEIKTICGKTDNPPLCESSVSPLLTPQLKPNTSSVLILAIQASITATKAAMAIVEKVDASDCQELYDDAVVNLEDAVNAVKSSDIATVNTNLSAAMTDYSTCNDGFEESGEPNPLAYVADKLTKMVSNCLAISTLIK